MNKQDIKKILVVSLSNIGDVVLTLPVIDILRSDFPGSKISLIIGPKAQSLFEKNPYFENIFLFKKKQSPWKMLKWIGSLRREKFDLVVDLRNTAIGLMLTPKYRTPLHKNGNGPLHMKEKHLKCLQTVYPYLENDPERSLWVSPEDKEQVKRIIQGVERFVVLAPGAADSSKRWPQEYFAELGDELSKKYRCRLILVGGKDDKDVCRRIAALMQSSPLDLSGEFSLIQVTELLAHACLLVCNDSAPMHLASYEGLPIVAVFGPTDPQKYRPWSRQSQYLKNSHGCLACSDPAGPAKHTCMNNISVKDVLQSIDDLKIFNTNK